MLDGKRSNNITIALSKFKVPLSELRKNLSSLSVDELLLFQPHIQGITEEEVQALRSLSDEQVLRLSKADRFVLEMSQVGRVREILGTLIFLETFGDKSVTFQTLNPHKH